jgi:polyphosphate kinase 2 (PPK2 family)
LRRIPERRNWAVFDRTLYGLVLVERIEVFCTIDEWKRAYREINEFERMLADDGVRVIKLLVHVSEEEQRKRMIKRLEDPHKRFKVGPEDFRNIAKRKQYIEAYDDMLERTDTDAAPWTVIATDYKWCARVQAIETIVKALSQGADLEPPPLAPEVAAAARSMWGWEPSGAKDTSEEKKSEKSQVGPHESGVTRQKHGASAHSGDH